MANPDLTLPKIFMTTATLDSTAVAQYLIDHPQFFEEHAGLLGEVRLEIYPPTRDQPTDQPTEQPTEQ